ncbi:hypothetical protein [Litorivita pollutaquae]|uniref:hypothetical protein n=1 Tax=Litorivita pollutaquae TaxID=2200892 RepID=UPI0013A67509|nr:hypothetical protein [Litorivita pollutaquae]
MDTNDAILRLASLVRADCGASDAARSVINYAWNNHRPIREFFRLDGANRKAALTLIDRDEWVDPQLLCDLIPELNDWV